MYHIKLKHMLYGLQNEEENTFNAKMLSHQGLHKMGKSKEAWWDADTSNGKGKKKRSASVNNWSADLFVKGTTTKNNEQRHDSVKTL